MAPGNGADLVVRVAANIQALQTDMASAAASVKSIETAVTTAHAASQGWAGSMNDLGHSWVLRIAEGQLLRDAVREVIATMKELVDLFPDLAMKGSVVGDVEESFKHLTKEAGLLSDELLGTLRAGTHGTIDDFALMQRTNKDLAAGLHLSQDEFGLLTQGAFALAKATGGSTAEALDKMSDAMVTGRVKAIALLTGKVDLKVAEELFAESLGATSKELSAEGKIEADRQAILAAVANGLARVGDQQLSLKDKIEQGRIAWANFQDDLGKTIAQSPVLAAGLDSVRASLLQAFGGDQKALIAAIAAGVVNAAIVVVDFGIGVGVMAGTVLQIWYGIKTAILAVETVIVGLVTAVGEVLLKADEIAGKVHLVPPDEYKKIEQTQIALRAMTVGLAEETAEAARGAAGHSALGEVITAGTGILMTTRDAMIAAQTAQEKQTAATTGAIGPLQQASAAVQEHGNYLKDVTDKTKAFDAAWVELTSMGSSYLATMATIDRALLEQVQYYVAAGAGVHTLAAAYPELTTAQIESVHKFDTESKAIALDLTKLWAEYDSLVVSGSETAYQKAGAAIDRWYADEVAKMVAAKRDTAEFYAAVSALDDQKWAHLNANTLAADIHSHEHLIKAAADLQAEYDFDMQHSESFTSAYLVNLKKTVDAAQFAATSWTTAMGGSLDGIAAKAVATTATVVGGFNQIAAASASATIAAGAKDPFADTMEGRLALLAAQQARNPSQFINATGLFAGLPGHAEGVTNAAAGHWATVGEKGPEAMYVPQGASILPNGTSPSGADGTTVIQLVVDGRVLAQVVDAHKTRSVKQSRQFPSA